MTNTYFSISISFLLFIITPAIGQHVQIDQVPIQDKIKLDGVISEKEWLDSKVLQLNRDSDWEIDIRIKYDDENIYLAISNLEGQDSSTLNAEVLIQTKENSSAWDENTYWFHSSYSNCFAQREYYIWEHCSTDHEGWGANTFPFKDGNDNMEFRISFETLEIDPSIKNSKMRIAFKVSGADEVHTYWPKEATIDDPQTWGSLIFN